MSDVNYIRLTHMNVQELHERGLLKKGNLVKFRFNNFNMIEYGLDSDDNDWCVGIISEIFWYVSSTVVALYPERDSVCYDLSVHNVSMGGLETINLELYEILLVSSE